MGLKDAFGSFVKSGVLEDAATAKMKEIVDGYKQIVAVLEPLGFTMGRFTVVMGILPEIHTSISGSINDIHEVGMTKLIDEHQGETLLVSLLKTLIMTRRLWEHMESNLTGVIINITLGVSPKVTVDVN